MSVWSWKRSGWLDCAFAVFLLTALILSLCSIGLRTSFSSFSTDINFNGGSYPEVGFFNLLLYITALLGMMCVVLRYVYVTDKNVVLSSYSHILNKISILPGISSFVGLLLVAAFPVNSKQKGGSVQTGGAYMFFGLGVLFSIMQTIITYMYSRFSKTFMARLLIVFILTGAFISSVILIEINKSKLSNIYGNNTISNISNETLPTKEKLVQPGEVRYIAFGLERAFVLFYVLFFLTFFLEFQKISTYMILRPLILSTPNDYSSSWTVNERV